MVKYTQDITAQKRLEIEIQQQAVGLSVQEEKLCQNLEALSRTQAELARQLAGSEELKREMQARDTKVGIE